LTSRPPLDWQRTVWDTIELDKAVGVAKKWAAAHGQNTLIIVVADHAHSMSITGTYWEGDGKKGREAVACIVRRSSQIIGH